MYWLFQMAWRDSRRNRSRLLLFISSMVIGIAALVAINSFSENLQHDIDKQAKTLLGADLTLQGTSTDGIQPVLDSIKGEQSSIINFASMIYFPNGGGTRLAQIRGQQGTYPFYGSLKTTPANITQKFMNGQNALLDKSVMLQFNAKIGDTVKVGELSFLIAGQIDAAPGRAGISASIAPVVLVPQKYLETTGLLQKGSRVEYQYFFKLDKSVDAEKLVKDLKPALDSLRYTSETVQGRKQGIGDAFHNLADFLNLVAFVALILGCIGVASAVHIYIKDKINTVAVLRCLGASGRQAFLIYLIQVAVMGLAGAIMGAIIGSLLQTTLPLVLKDFLPIDDISTDISWKSIASGILTGFSIALLFALPPLLAIRNVSPLRTLRASFEETPAVRDPLRWLVYALIVLFIGGFTWFQTGDIKASLSFLGGIALSFFLLTAVAMGLTWLVRKFFPTRWSYVTRQGIANLYRPNNQTIILIVSIGLGTFLIANLFAVQQLLLDQLSFSGSGRQPNMILFDIQSSQKDSIAQLTRNHNLPILQEVPIVTMHLDEINGITKQQSMKDTTLGIQDWVFDREYRVTYRDTLIDSETLVEGVWPGKNKDSIYVSISDFIAKEMKATVGSHLTMNVQGALMHVVVCGIRKVNFNRVQTNFLIIFPTGVLEKAPQFNVLVTRTDSVGQSARFQQAVVRQFPNVSVIDLTQILKTVDEVLGKVSFVIRFMALLSILTGLLVLIGSVTLSKYQRIQESVLLRTLGAMRKQILRINAVEYFILGLLSTLTGLILSIGSSYLLAKFVFKIPFTLNAWPLLGLMFGITLLMVLIGMFNIRDVVRKSPLEVLRSEV